MFPRIGFMMALTMAVLVGGVAAPRTAEAWRNYYENVPLTPYGYATGYGYAYPGAPFYPGYGPPYQAYVPPYYSVYRQPHQAYGPAYVGRYMGPRYRVVYSPGTYDYRY